jgi:hypothetical protein
MLPWSWAEERLAAAHNYWIATSGPHASPIWALWRDEALVFSCSPRSRKARELARDPRVVVHLESGADVVIIEGRAAQVDPDDDLMRSYSDKYGPTDPAIGDWYRVEPRRILAWTETAYPDDATCFEP